MGHARRRTLVVVLAVVTLALGRAPTAGTVTGLPDEPRASPIRIDAVVTDAKGRPILDLKPADFELRENGVTRTLSTVELRTPGRAGAVETSVIASDADEARAAKQPGTRVFAIFLDEFHVSAGANSDRVRAALADFVQARLRPNDLAMVVKPLDSLTSLRFTRDRVALAAAIDTFAGRQGDYAPRTPFEATYIGRTPGAVQAARAQIATAALRQLALRFGDLHADQGVFVVVSEGFPRMTPVTRGTRVPDLQGVVRAASRFSLPMYAFSPADPLPIAEDATPRDTPASTLQWMAAQTGGRATLDGSDLAGGLQRMADDLAGYYVLTYQSPLADGRFHPVEVRTTRRNAQVRTAAGFWAPLSSAWWASLSPAPFTMGRRALHRSALLNVWTGLTRDAAGRARMSVTWEPRGTSAPPASVTVKAQTVGGIVLFEGDIAPVGTGGAVPDRARFEVPAGRIELDLEIVGVNGVTLDTDARDMDVPVVDPRAAGPALYAPEVLRARSNREFNSLIRNPDPTPTPDRGFNRSDRLLIRVPAWQADGAAVQVTASILNRWAQPMRLLDRTPDVPGITTAQFDLPLAWLAPGEYLIAITGRTARGVANDRITITVR